MTHTNDVARACPPTEDGRRYRFQRLSLPLILADMRFDGAAPKAGDHVPDFDLPLVGGGRFRRAELADTGPVLLVFGSATCPVTDDAAPRLRDLHARFGHAVRFVMVNVREAHPGDALPQPTTDAAKLDRATRLRDLHALPFEVAVDDVDGRLHRALSPKPNSAYLLGHDGTILFRAHWANDGEAIGEALAAVTAARALPRLESGGLVKAMVRMLPRVAPVMDRAGRGAWADLWRVAPPLAVLASLLKLLRPGRA